jgi:regulator of protease activity HflC (stomatin/prohibitin superfamily)
LFSPPPEVIAETKATAAQNQAILTQQARANAELSRKQAEINKAIADRAYQQQMGMSVEQYMHIRSIEIEKEKVELLKNHQNVTVIFGGGENKFSYPIK